MKIVKKLFTGFLIFLIVASLAAIVYVLQWEEPAIVKPAKEAKQTSRLQKVLPEAEKDKKAGDKPADLSRKPGKDKQSDVVASIGKLPLPLRQVAIIIDDIGNDLQPVKNLLKIDAAITFAVMPLCPHSREAAESLHAANREILLHLPMEPKSYPREKPGNGALFTEMNEKEIVFQLNKDLAAVPYVVGVNNHMGSKFMDDEEKLRLVFEVLKKKNMFFVDSRTTPDSKAYPASQKTGLPFASRKIFLDNNHNYKDIYKIINQIAGDTQAGDVSPIIIIGHPHPETIRAIRDGVRIFREKGINIVPVSQLIKNKAPRRSS